NSEPGEGTTFLIHLPLLEHAGATSGVIEATASTVIPQGHETILVVEDEPSVRSLLCATLETSGYRVFSADDGAEAMNFLMQNTTVDAVILDLDLPRLS